jgi:hypothetical protein
MLEHEEHIPLQPDTHELDDANGDVGVGVNARLAGDVAEVRTQLG